MSRSDYLEDCDDTWSAIRWAGAVKSAINGKRGQDFLKELIERLDDMPKKELIGDSLVTVEGQYCALGVVGSARGIDLTKIDPDDFDQVAKQFGIAPAMAREIVYENDEQVDDYDWVTVTICGPLRSPYERHTQSVRVQVDNVPKLRWKHMRNWAQTNLKKEIKHG